MIDVLVFVLGFVLALRLAVALYAIVDLGWAGARYRPRIARAILGALALYLGGAWLAGGHLGVYALAGATFVVLHGLHYAGLRAYTRWLRARNAAA